MFCHLLSFALKYNDNITDIWSNDVTDKNDGFDHYVDDNGDDDDDEKEWSAGGNGKCSVKTKIGKRARSCPRLWGHTYRLL